jgi:hypothetical protein
MLEKRRYFLKFYVQEEEHTSLIRATKPMIITITESKSLPEDGSFHSKKHKIYLLKILQLSQEILNEMTSYVLNHKGREVISENIKRFKKRMATDSC